jgi:hypothetical protein
MAREVERRGSIEEAADIYPDINQAKHMSYARTPLPLMFSVLLYERTVIFVPPMSKEDLEQRWGLPLDQLLELARAGLVQPIIGHTLDYAADHFDGLVEIRPPSLWARGLTVLDHLGMGSALDERECPLPIGEMANLNTLRFKYRKYFPGLDGADLSDRIKRELLTNYADLCIFGEQRLADSLQYSGSAQQVADRLILANEVRTYPILFGMGGTANYDTRSLRRDAKAHDTLSPLPRRRRNIIPGNLDLLFSGMGIVISAMGARDLIDFHASGNGQLLRRAMAHFERQAHKVSAGSRSEADHDRFVELAATLESIIRSVSRELASPSFVKKARRIEQASRAILKVGSPAVGAWLGHMLGSSVLEGIGGGAVVQQLVIEPLREKIVDAAMVARFRPGLANLWRIAQREELSAHA